MFRRALDPARGRCESCSAAAAERGNEKGGGILEIGRGGEGVRRTGEMALTSNPDGRAGVRNDCSDEKLSSGAGDSKTGDVADCACRSVADVDALKSENEGESKDSADCGGCRDVAEEKWKSEKSSSPKGSEAVANVCAAEVAGRRAGGDVPGMGSVRAGPAAFDAFGMAVGVALRDIEGRAGMIGLDCTGTVAEDKKSVNSSSSSSNEVNGKEAGRFGGADCTDAIGGGARGGGRGATLWERTEGGGGREKAGVGVGRRPASTPPVV